MSGDLRILNSIFDPSSWFIQEKCKNRDLASFNQSLIIFAVLKIVFRSCSSQGEFAQWSTSVLLVSVFLKIFFYSFQKYLHVNKTRTSIHSFRNVTVNYLEVATYWLS